MKRLTVALCLLLVAGFTLSAAVDARADELPAGAVASDSSFGGVNLVVGDGSASVDSVSVPAADPSGNAYSQVLTLSQGSVLEFPAVSGETVKIYAQVPQDGSALSFLISSDAGLSEVLESTTDDNALAYAEYPVTADGTYTLTVDGPSASIYEVVVE